MPGDRDPAQQAPEAWWARPERTGPNAAPPYAEHPAATWSRSSGSSSARTITPATARVRSSRPAQAYRGRPPAFGDQRGLTAVGATIAVLILAGLGAGVDVATGSGLRTVFTVAFVVAAALAAATVHTEDLIASVVLVPLTFAVVAGMAGLVEGSSLGTFIRLVEAVAITMINAAPSLMMATATAAVIAGGRAYAHRRAGRSRRGLAGRAHA